MSKKFDELYESILNEAKLSYDDLDKMSNQSSKVVGQNSKGDVYASKFNHRLYMGDNMEGDSFTNAQDYVILNQTISTGKYSLTLYKDGKLVNNTMYGRLKALLGGGKISTGLFSKGNVTFKDEDNMFKFASKFLGMK